MRKDISATALLVCTLMFVGAGCAPSTVTVNSGGPAAARPSSTTLDLRGKGLTTVPQSAFADARIQVLDVSGNQLTGALPAEIRKLTSLRVLDASDNQMTGVPAEIGQLSQLEELDLSNNKLTGLPMEFGNLASLRVLDLRGNAVSQQDLAEIRGKIPQAQILE